MERYRDTRPARSEYERSRSQTATRRAKKIMYMRAHRLRNPEKAKARQATRYAVETGLIVRTPCVHCGAVKSQAHHRDYSKPLDVVWACFKCHREIEHGQIVSVESF
jgi:ribosomal protein S27AE